MVGAVCSSTHLITEHTPLLKSIQNIGYTIASYIRNSSATRLIDDV
jgi:hypothetical protein